MLAIKESGAHLGEVLHGRFVSALRHLLDSLGVIHLDFVRSLLVDTHVTCRAKEALRKYQGAMLLSGKKRSTL